MYNFVEQKLNSWWIYKRKYQRVNMGVNDKAALLRSIVSLKTVPEGRNKVWQISRLLEKSQIVNQGHGEYFYSIDETCVPLLADKVIDNMPIDYSIIVGHSLNDLKEINGNFDNEIAQQNLQMIDVLEKYINRISAGIKNEKTKGYIRGIIDKKAQSLEEALQRILFINQILWQSKHTLLGFGRIDKILGNFEIKDDSKIYIMDFMKTLHEFYNFKSNSLLGDTGQIFILGGLEPDGTYFCNEYTYLFVECIKELGLPDPKALIRASMCMPEKLLLVASQCIATGVGSPLISNDDVVIPTLIEFGYSKEDAYNYGTSACWEPLAIGKSLEQNNIASIQYAKAVHNTCMDASLTDCKTYAEVVAIFKKYLDQEVKEVEESIDRIDWECDPLLTLFTEGCLKNNCDISQGGAVYNNYGLLSEGIASAVNSLLNIKKYCFDEGTISLETIKKCISENYEGYEKEREIFSQNPIAFGTDSEEALNFTNEIIEYTIGSLKSYRNKFGGKAKFGFSSPNYVKNGLKVGATVDGRFAYTPFATHISRDSGDPITEIVNFASKLHYEGFNANANVVDIMIQPNLIIDNINKFVQYLKIMIKEGIFQVQFNVLSYEKLVDAKAHPEKYPSLIVRVWGFSAYFRDLPASYQDQLIRRAKEMTRA